MLSKINSLVFFIFITSSCTSIKQQTNKDTWMIQRSVSDNIGGVKAWSYAGSHVAVIPNSWNLDSIVVYHNGSICKEWEENGLRIEKTRLASVIISTETGSMNAIDSSVDKSVSESGVISIFDEQGNNIYKGSIDKIHGRGNMSWKNKKKPYNIKLKEKVSLFNFRKSRSYCFLGASDPSMLKNKITYWYAERLGMPYSIRTHHVSLWTNGEYRGVYLMTEKVSAGKSGANLQGDDSEDCGVIIEMPQSGDSPKMQFKTASGSTIALKDPKIVSKDNFERIRQRYLQMEASVISDNNPNSNDISQYLDVESFAKYYLLQEVFYNYDAYSGSYYMYKDADFVDSLFYCAPLWDMDNCFHASLREACSFYNRKHTGFISSLCSNPTFWNEVQAIYNNEFSPLLESFTTEIDSLYSVIKYDLDLDNLLYHRSVSPGVDVEYIKQFMDLRKEF